MKQAIKRLVLVVLVALIRVGVAIGALCHWKSIVRLSRYAYWRARLERLGAGTEIYPYVVINGAENVRIGNHCSLGAFLHIWGEGGVTIGDDVLIASHTAITSLTHNKHAIRFRGTLVKKPVIIGDNVWIGAGSVILPGVSIGSGSIIGAGAVVTHDVPSGVVVTGVPGKIKY